MKEQNTNTPAKTPLYKKKWVIALAAVLVVVILAVAFGELTPTEEAAAPAVETLTQNDPAPADADPTTEAPAEADIPRFTIAYVNDTSIGPQNSVRRYGYYVVVYDEVTTAEMEVLAAYIVEGIKAEKDFNAIQFFFHDHPTFVGLFATLGVATYAPQGVIGNAGNVSAGDYSTHEFNFNLREKDWSLRPTAEMLEAHTFWHETWAGQYDYITTATDTPDEEVVNEITADALGLTLDELAEIMQAISLWQMSR